MYFIQRSAVRRLTVCIGLTAGGTLLAGGVMARQAAPDDNAPVATKAAPPVARVVITGSNISRLDLEGPTAVEVIRRDAIEKSGAATVDELLGQLTSATITQDSTETGVYSPGASSVAMRGIGAKYVLILLNGRRLANYGYAQGSQSSFVDLNNIPLAAIESVEILRDGASAVYGSDAVAGVINFKTRSNYRGLEASASASVNQQRDGGTASASLSTGLGDLSVDGRNTLLTLDLFRRRPLMSDRHAATRSKDLRALGGPDRRNPTIDRGTVIDLRNGESYAIPGCNGTLAPSPRGRPGNACLSDPATQLTPQLERSGVSLIHTKRLNQSDELFLEIGLNHNVSTYQASAPNFDTRSLVVDTRGSLNPALAQLPRAGAGLNGFNPGDPLVVLRSLDEAGPMVQQVRSDTARVVAGWRGDIGAWESEFGLSLNRNRIDDRVGNQLLRDRSSQALQLGVSGVGGYDPFAAENPESSWAPLLITAQRRAVSTLNALDFKMSNPTWFKLAERPLGFAWGVQASRETVRDTPDANVLADNIVGSMATAVDAGRSIYSIYGELSINPSARTEMQFALRADHYSDAGSAVNPKLALSWRPLPTVLLRGSANTSFKAPTLPEVAMSTVASVPVQDHAFCTPLGLSNAQCYSGIPAYATGNPDLKPEKASNFALGALFEPSKALSFALDWYSIHQRDTIGVLDQQYILDHEDSIPGYAAYVRRGPFNPALAQRFPGLDRGQLESMTLPFVNVGRTNSEGLDLSLRYTLALGQYGSLTLRDSLTSTLRFEQSVVPGAPVTDRVGGIYWPKWSNNANLSYRYQNKEASLTALTHASTLNIPDPSMAQDPATTAKRLPSYTVWNLNLSMQPLKDLIVNAGVNNLFATKPIYSNSDYVQGYLQGNNVLTGRVFYLSARRAFK